MPSVDLKTPDGRVITVRDVPEGASRADILRLAREQRPTAMAETVPKDTPGLVKPSVGRFLGAGLKNRAGDILATAGGALVPGSGALPFAGRLLASEAGQELGDVMATGKVTPGYGAATQLVGEGVGKVVRPLLSVATYNRFAQRTAKSLAEWLKDTVPAFREAADEKGLARFAHTTGQRAISGEFDSALASIKPQVTSRPIWLPRDDIRELGLTTNTWRDVPTGRLRNQMEQYGEVSVADAIDKMAGVWKRNPGLYRRTVNTVQQDLDRVNLGDTYRDASAAYKVGAGFIEFAEKGKFLHGEQFDPVKAHRALDTHGKILNRRGLDEIRQIIRGPGEETVKEVKHSPWVQRLEGALLGGAAGLPFGIPHSIGGAAGGIAASTMAPRTTYTGVPLTPLGRFATEVLPRSVPAYGVREGVRDLNLRQALPQIRVPPVEQFALPESEARP